MCHCGKVCHLLIMIMCLGITYLTRTEMHNVISISQEKHVFFFSSCCINMYVSYSKNVSILQKKKRLYTHTHTHTHTHTQRLYICAHTYIHAYVCIYINCFCLKYFKSMLNVC